MSAEWIRPTFCEGGACVEYRTVDGKVYVRNGGTENLHDDGNMLVFTVAEWDTFVAGLVAERMPRLAAYERALLTAGQDLDRYKGWLAIANDELNAAIAEREVLRHRDRRTQAVVDAAVAWRASSDSYKAQTALVLAVDAYEKGPTEPPASPLPAEQPPVEGTATDGLEAQGGAQRAAVDPEEINAAAMSLDGHQTVVMTDRPTGGCADCVDDRPIWSACPDCEERFCGWACVDDHRSPGTCPKYADGVLTGIGEGIQVALDGLHAQEKRRADLANREAGRVGPRRIQAHR